MSSARSSLAAFRPRRAGRPRPSHQSAAEVWAWSGEDLGVRGPGGPAAPSGHPPAASRKPAGYQQLLAAVEAANPVGELAVIADNLSQEAWWRIFRRAALAGQSLANPNEITLARKVRPAS